VSSEEQGAELNQKPHRKLKVWQASIALWSRFYREIQHFPAHERFGIAAQLQRAAVLIPSNIAPKKYQGTAAISVYCPGFSERIRYSRGNLFSPGILGKDYLRPYRA